jgi:hypothetical protein
MLAGRLIHYKIAIKVILLRNVQYAYNVKRGLHSLSNEKVCFVGKRWEGGIVTVWKSSCGTVAVIWLVFLTSGILLNWISPNLAPLSLFIAIGTGLAFSARDKSEDKKLLAQYQQYSKDISNVGVFCEALRYHRVAGLYEFAIDTLTRLLPQIGETDGHLLNTRQRDYLHTELASSYDSNFVLAILKALKQVGDSYSIHPVEKAALGYCPSANDGRVRGAGQDCLDAILERTNRERMLQSLLRASEQPDSEADTLLRPAGPTLTEDSQLLLRPGEDDPTQPNRQPGR